jgi:hypothetical protein
VRRKQANGTTRKKHGEKRRRHLKSRYKTLVQYQYRNLTTEKEIDANDLEAFHKFIPPSFDDPILRPGEEPPEGPPINLADLILSKIAEHEAAEGGRQPDEAFEEEDVQLPPMAVEVYTQYVSPFLQHQI